MNKSQFNCMAEALRRCVVFHPEEHIKDVWSGLGTYTNYKSVLDSGMMQYAHVKNPRYKNWFSLTDKGCKIVQYWIDKGYGAHSFDNLICLKLIN